jgi:hypothetical protein
MDYHFHKRKWIILNNQGADKEMSHTGREREKKRAVPSERKLRETTNKSKNIMEV